MLFRKALYPILGIFTGMKLKYFICWCILSLGCAGTAYSRTVNKKHKEEIKLVEAYTQRTIPGVQGAAPQVSTHFILIWEGAKYPETFFWRGENGWLPCNMVRAHRAAKGAAKLSPEIDYMSEPISANKIHKGDTLQLTPVSGGKFPVPAGIPDSAKNMLYYKIAGSGWLGFPIKNIGRKRDIAMP